MQYQEYRQPKRRGTQSPQAAPPQPPQGPMGPGFFPPPSSVPPMPPMPQTPPMQSMPPMPPAGMNPPPQPNPNAPKLPPPDQKPPMKGKKWLILIALVAAVGGFLVFRQIKVTEQINKQNEIIAEVDALQNVFLQNVYVDDIHLGGMTAEQAEYNQYAPILMTSVDTDAKQCAAERQAILQRLGAGKWQIFGAHGYKKDYAVHVE